MLKQVVLPAPFGPMSATMAPVGTSKDACETAFRPRKDLEMPSAAQHLLPQAQFARERRPDAVRQEHDYQQASRCRRTPA